MPRHEASSAVANVPPSETSAQVTEHRKKDQRALQLSVSTTTTMTILDPETLEARTITCTSLMQKIQGVNEQHFNQLTEMLQTGTDNAEREPEVRQPPALERGGSAPDADEDPLVC